MQESERKPLILTMRLDDDSAAFSMTSVNIIFTRTKSFSGTSNFISSFA
nr:hypothetical protein [Mucilaginibacter sp. E4BP6]